MVIVRLVVLVVLAASASAMEARLLLPDPMPPGVAVLGHIEIEGPTSQANSLEFPQVDGLSWTLQPGIEHRQSIVNGVSSSSERIPFALTGRDAGRITIPAVTVHFADGTQVRTAPLAIDIAAGDARLTGEALADARFEPAEIVPGEPTTLVVRLYLRQGSADELALKPPEHAIPLGEPAAKHGQTSAASGEAWNVITWRWQMTFPEPGSYRVDGQQPYEIPAGLLHVYRRNVAVKPATVTVTALPSEGRPDDFAGLIGPVSAEARLERDRIAAGEGTALLLTVSGRQVGLLARPRLPTLPGLQAYPRDGGGDTDGSRSFAWDVVPNAPGNFAVPAFSFAYFDPTTHAYRRAASKPLSLTVVPGRSRDLTVAGAMPATSPATILPPSPAVLPPPLRGRGAAVPPPALGPLAALLSVAAGALGVGCLRTLRRPRRRRRGLALARAAESGNLERIADAVHALRPALADDASRHACDALVAAIDQARFGGQPLTDIARHVAVLERID